MKKNLECTYCDGNAKLSVEKKDISYRKEVFCIDQYFYKCEKCEEEFTTDEADDRSLIQLHNQYRVKHSIPFVEDIIAMRQKYDLPAAKMNEVLGMGANGYSNFEKGDMPSPALGTLLFVANDPVEFKKMVSRKPDIFSELAYNNLLEKIDLLIDQSRKITKDRIDLHDAPSTLNGFRSPNFNKIASLVCFFLGKCKNEFNDRLKLNKLLFYADFLNFKENGLSITGLSYRAIQYGPVPSFYENVYTSLENESYIHSNWVKGQNGGGVEIFELADGFDLRLFSEKELRIINFICEQFKETPSWDMVEKSHSETGWRECYPNKSIIDYQQFSSDLTLDINE
jgi:uncharacterized phage-associated protein